MLLLRRRFTLALLLAVGILAAGQFQSVYAQANRPALYEFGAGGCNLLRSITMWGESHVNFPLIWSIRVKISIE